MSVCVWVSGYSAPPPPLSLSLSVKLAKLLTHVVVHLLLFRSKDSIQIDLDVKSASLELNDQLTLYFAVFSIIILDFTQQDSQTSFFENA